MTSRRKWHNVFCFRSWLGWKQVHQQLVSSRGLCVTVREPGLCLLSQIRRSHWHLSLDWESVAWSTVASWLTVRPAPPQPTSREHQRPPEAGHHSPWGWWGPPSPKLEWSSWNCQTLILLPSSDISAPVSWNICRGPIETVLYQRFVSCWYDQTIFSQFNIWRWRWGGDVDAGTNTS